ncbi:MAG: DUF3467 domain-containing protein [Pseudoflavonifractor sp.]|nr:DUF3467 domain-containing protein [Alloprevotella sp.]MCM1115920.1 DUF3467 domain-containing protein [Pseudoflavonifractor sp.]
MDKQKPQELKIEVTPEVASGCYSNLAVISHTPNEMFMDFIAMVPNMQQARVQSRIIMTPENAKNLLFALSDNIKKYEATFGEIKPRTPNTPANPNEIRNPFMTGGKA